MTDKLESMLKFRAPLALLQQLKAAALVLGMSRSALVRKAVRVGVDKLLNEHIEKHREGGSHE